MQVRASTQLGGAVHAPLLNCRCLLIRCFNRCVRLVHTSEQSCRTLQKFWCLHQLFKGCSVFLLSEVETWANNWAMRRRWSWVFSSQSGLQNPLARGQELSLTWSRCGLTWMTANDPFAKESRQPSVEVSLPAISSKLTLLRNLPGIQVDTQLARADIAQGGHRGSLRIPPLHWAELVHSVIGRGVLDHNASLIALFDDGSP